MKFNIKKQIDAIKQMCYTVNEHISLSVHYENGVVASYNMDDSRSYLSLMSVQGTPESLKVLTIPAFVQFNGKDYPVRIITGFFLMGLTPDTVIERLELPATIDHISPRAFFDVENKLHTIKIPNPALLMDVEIPESVKVFGEPYKTVDERLKHHFRIDYESGYSLLFRLNKNNDAVSVCDVENPENAICVTIPEEVVVNDDEKYPVTEIEEDCFENCENMRMVRIPNTIKAIRMFAFFGCTALESVTIPESVRFIEVGAFDSTNITSLNIPKSVEAIGGSICSNCRRLESIAVDKENKCYDSRNDCNAIIKTDTDTLIQGFAKTVIPDSVKSIHFEAFFATSHLKTITIPDSVNEIAYDAFRSCLDLEEIVISDPTLLDDVDLEKEVDIVTPTEKSQVVSSLVQSLKTE